MLDFMTVSVTIKKGTTEIAPKFLVGRQTTDLMIRGGDFYAIWDEEQHLWSTNEDTAVRLIDKETNNYIESHKDILGDNYRVLYMWDTDSGMIDKWLHYVQKQRRDSFHMLDESITFQNTVTTKESYVSKRLGYPIEPCSIDAYDELMSVLYSTEERRKLEWAIGSIISGDSKKIQKFIVLYGAAGTGKSTVLNIIQELFDGYYSTFDAKALGSANSSFALESFRSNPLVAIQHDGDLSHIEDNTRLNSLVSHELMTVNEKFKSAYSNSFKSFLFMGTNRPVKITDAKSGIIRRLIDVSPTGNKISSGRYKTLMSQIKFELGGIAQHCLDIYNENPGYYDSYIPTMMLGASNDFYNYVMDSFDVFKKEDGVTLKQAWEMYKVYCEDAKVPYPFSQRAFKEELRNYFSDFDERALLGGDVRVRNYYSGFLTDKFESRDVSEQEDEPEKTWLILDKVESLLDKSLSGCPAQYAKKTKDGLVPTSKWANVSTKLVDIDTRLPHYVQVPDSHIVIDFDIRDSTGNKSLDLNIKEAAKWPPTYAELSQSGQGIHLHYIYSGDVAKLANTYAEHIEVKVYLGNSSLRRKLTYCNDIPIATIGSGLPFKKEKGMINFERFEDDKHLKAFIAKQLRKGSHPGTKPSIDFIYSGLEKAYESGMEYDVSDMHSDILDFAMGSTNHKDYCVNLVTKMKFKSKEFDPSTSFGVSEEDEITIFDVEVFPNLYVLVYKKVGKDKQPVVLINPTSALAEQLLKMKLVGFNCRRYDNHIIVAWSYGYSNMDLYRLSKNIIGKVPNSFLSQGWNASYTDIYDYSSVKQSLKKFEIDLGLHHQELGYDWDTPVPEELWDKVAEYCVNDVLATEAVWNATEGDFVARKILAEIAGMTPNDTTNSLTTRIIFGSNKHPKLIYTDLATGEQY